MRNAEIRLEAAGAGVKLWQIAEALGIADCSLSRKLRRELSDADKAKIRKIITEVGNKEGWEYERKNNT